MYRALASRAPGAKLMFILGLSLRPGTPEGPVTVEEVAITL